MAAYGGSAHWRDSARSSRFFLIDARASFFILFFLVHIQLWTGVLALVNIVFFSVIEHYGFSIPVFLRWLRLNIAGPIKLSQPWWIQ